MMSCITQNGDKLQRRKKCLLEWRFFQIDGIERNKSKQIKLTVEQQLDVRVTNDSEKDRAIDARLYLFRAEEENGAWRSESELKLKRSRETVRLNRLLDCVG
jgi:hypothetical protein